MSNAPAPKSENEAVRLYRPFVAKQAGRYLGSGVPFEDLVQEGLLAVALAFRKWRADGGASFLTWIRHPVRNALSELVERSGKHGVKYAKGSVGHVSMDMNATEVLAKHFKAEDGCTLHELIGEETSERDALALKNLPKIFSLLTAKERCVLRLRFVGGKTLQECGHVLGVSRERVRQIESKALMSLRGELGRQLKKNGVADA